MSTFQSPLQSGTVTNGAGKNLGQALLTQTATLAFTDTVKSLFVLPANSQIIDFYVDVTTVFNAAGTDLLDLGVLGGTANLFTDDLDLSSLGRKLASADASQVVNYADVGDTDVTVTATYTQTSTAATTGAARITVVYAVNKILPT